MAAGVKFNYPGSNKNSTDELLGAGETFTGGAEAISITEPTQSVTVSVFSDVASAANGLELRFSMDGENWDHIEYYNVEAGVELSKESTMRHRYFQVKYTTVDAQGTFRLQTIYNSRMGADSAGTDPISVRFSDGQSHAPLAVGGLGAFGDVITAELLPQAQIDFVYGDNIDTQFEVEKNGGSVSFADSMAVCTSGTSLGGEAQINTIATARYRPGQGLILRMSAIFSTPAVGVRQIAGGNGFEENGLFFGVDDVTGLFGVCRRHDGLREIRTLTVSVAATGAETGTVTLNGTGFSVSLTAGSIAATAQEIAEGTYAGWQAWAADDKVYFASDTAEVMAGAFTFSSTGAGAGTFAQDTVGVAPTYEWTPKASWNTDRMDGKGPSKVTLDPTKGNVYTVKMQYLGFGAIDYFVENPDTGLPQLVHRVKYANKNTIPLLGNPTLNVCVGVVNVSDTTSTVVKAGSMAIFTEGIASLRLPAHGTSVDTSISVSVPVLSIRNNVGFVDSTSRLNVRDLIPLMLGFATSAGSKPMRYSVVIGGVLTDPLWTLFDATHSLASVDTSATAITGGDSIIASGLSRDGDAVIPLVDQEIHVQPGKVLTLVMEPTGSAADITASISWREDV